MRCFLKNLAEACTCKVFNFCRENNDTLDRKKTVTFTKKINFSHLLKENNDDNT